MADSSRRDFVVPQVQSWTSLEDARQCIGMQLGATLPDTAWQDFDRLAGHVRRIRAISPDHMAALASFYERRLGGFVRLYDPQTRTEKTTFSPASTATCILSLKAAGKWRAADAPWAGQDDRLAAAFLDPGHTSADLPPDNIFTTAFSLEAAALLLEGIPGWEEEEVYAERVRLIERAQAILLNGRPPAGAEGKGSPPPQTGLAHGAVSLTGYPPSAFLTQLAIRSLVRSSRLPGSNARRAEIEAAIEKVRDWARQTVVEQVALLSTGGEYGDIYQAGYAAILYASHTSPNKMPPSDARMVAAAVDHFFRAQRTDGAWPRSAPQFHYPAVGAAFAYEYEFLAQLLETPALGNVVQPYFDGLVTAAERLESTAYLLSGAATGASARAWSSSHHPQATGPESWATASAYHFLAGVDRLVSEANRRAAFDYLGHPYQRPASRKIRPFGSDFMDCDLYIRGQRASFVQTLRDRVYLPIAARAEEVPEGQPLDGVVTTGILYGPPGTSKTGIARMLAQHLGWPLLELDPSHFLRRGLDGVQAEADRVFRILATLERVVVLLDEVDEMVRAREDADEAFSRFLTTAMLPKLATIHDARRSIFLVATNYIAHFDFAIQRPGRFDVVLQVLPPTLAAKYQQSKDLEDLVDRLAVDPHNHDIPGRVADFTYIELRALQAELKGRDDAAALSTIRDHHARCTMQSPTRTKQGAKTWKQVSEDERKWVRA